MHHYGPLGVIAHALNDVLSREITTMDGDIGFGDLATDIWMYLIPFSAMGVRDDYDSSWQLYDRFILKFRQIFVGQAQDVFQTFLGVLTQQGGRLYFH